MVSGLMAIIHLTYRFRYPYVIFFVFLLMDYMRLAYYDIEKF